MLGVRAVIRPGARPRVGPDVGWGRIAMASESDPLPAVRTAREFLEAIRRSGVLSEQQVEKVRDRVRVGRYPREVLDLARRLIRNDTLTVYQARRLLYGQGE